MPPESYFDLKSSDQKDILLAAADELNREPAVLEKDIWVCWTLQVLFSMPDHHPMAFKGGTSLSKVYEIINRFSEDVDITLDYRQFGDDFDPFAEGASGNQIKKFSDRLKGYVRDYAHSHIEPHLRDQLDTLKSTDSHEIRVDDDGEKIWVSYPSAVEASDEYLKPEVLIELGGRNVIDPNETHTITPYVSGIAENVVFPSCEVTVLSPERTFWEKATLIHVECNRGELKENAERLSRHWYDLAKLAAHDIGRSATQNRDLLEDVVRHKKIFYNAGYANYDACLSRSLKLVPDTKSVDQLRVDYEKMVAAGMMYEDAPSFERIMGELEHLMEQINS